VSRHHSIIILLSGLAMCGPALANDLVKRSPLKAIEAYTFVLPAIDCHRDTDLNITTNSAALQKLLRDASASLADDQADEMEAAAVKGAKAYERSVAGKGRQAYCRTAYQRYGPSGSVYRGLVVAKSK
jgi:hypothetical protein